MDDLALLRALWPRLSRVKRKAIYWAVRLAARTERRWVFVFEPLILGG